MGDKTYKITAVQPRADWEGNYGPMKAFALQLESVDGWVSLNQVPKTPAPVVGQDLFGSITSQVKNGQTFFKFNKAKNPNYGGGSQGGSSVNQKDIEFMIMMLEELTGRREVPTHPTPHHDTLPTDEDMTKEFTLDMIPDDKEEINLADIPF